MCICLGNKHIIYILGRIISDGASNGGFRMTTVLPLTTILPVEKKVINMSGTIAKKLHHTCL
jgi:hypothetical protein